MREFGQDQPKASSPEKSILKQPTDWSISNNGVNGSTSTVNAKAVNGKVRKCSFKDDIYRMENSSTPTIATEHVHGYKREISHR